MAKVVSCPACGEAIGIPSCGFCGAELSVDAVDQLRDRAGGYREHSAADQDQIWSDEDQTASDRDQTWSDHDQTASDSDQRSADDDQHAADEEFAAGGDALTYQRSALARKHSSRVRADVSSLRDETAAARLRTAEERDQAAARRDRGAAGRDALARLHDLEDDTDATREEVVLRARRDRARAAADRAKAADDRARARTDREEAARDRAEAQRHRGEHAERLKLAATDELTGAWTRKWGLAAVARELERGQRTGAALALAFIDVDGLKQVNDSQGHLAGDALLRLLGQTVRTNLRAYDVIVRYGGDEFVCAMPNLSTPEARARFKKIAAAVRAGDGGHSITVGFTDAEPTDTLQDLLARADADLLEARHSGHGNN